MAPIIEIKNVSKQYLLGEAANMYGNFRELLTHAFRKPWEIFRKPGAGADGKQSSFWALRNVSFEVEKGDTVAIIGSNGAGKSTLLKILSRITDPTEGFINVRGKIASLLEVGTGFHPELSGRENVYLNGAILGMRRPEIDAKFDEIVSFAGIEKFLDTPVKRYSSGMYVRLAFAIAAHLEPEILIVDEVLAVGDVAFQKKCLGKMAEAHASARTVLFVSHNLAAVEALCNKGVVLNQGEVVFTGTAKESIKYYLTNLAGEGASSGTHTVVFSSAPSRLSKYRPILTRLELYTEDDQPFSGELPVGSSLKAVIRLNLEEPCTSFDPFLSFTANGGQLICTACSAYEPTRVHEERSGEQVFTCEIPSLPLVPGDYKIDAGIYLRGVEMDLVEGASRLTVIPVDYYGTGIVPTRGSFLLQNRWELATKREEVTA